MKDDEIRVRCSAEQKAEIASTAAKAGLSVSQFVLSASLAKAREGK